MAKRDNLKPIELHLQKLEDMMKQILHEYTSINSSQKKNLSLGDNLTGKVILFSVFTIIAMVFIVFSEIVYLKKYWTQRKLI